MKVDLDAPEPRAASAAWPPVAEDGYEAALRAADALFSGGRAPTSRDPAAPEAYAADAETLAHPGGGRVLRVIDEPPSPEMARLEAEFAPKRRGRKPGSKNKPKVPTPALMGGLLTSAFPAPAPSTSSNPTSASPMNASSMNASSMNASSMNASPMNGRLMNAPVSAQSSEARVVAAVPATLSRPAMTVVRPAAAPAEMGASRGERYAWVRTRLKPGEQWKRRLPKVAW